MKIKTTRKELHNSFKNVYQCGYCDLQYIFLYEEPLFYNSGVYGWNFDGFPVWGTDTVIITGYRNMTGERIPSELIKKYSDKAENICKKYSFKDYDKRKKALERNKNRFISELLEA